MSTLQVSNVNFESTANNQLVYAANTLTIRSGGTNVIFANATSINISTSATFSNTIIANGSTGTAGQVLLSSATGVYWGAGSAANLTLYTSGSGTWTKPASGTFVRVRMWGGGGSGAHAGGGSRVVGGGGGGIYAERYYILSDLAATESYSVGAGGVAITANTAGGVNGNPGGTSTFSTGTNALSAYGGGGGGSQTGGANGGYSGTLFAVGTTAGSTTGVSATQTWQGGDGGFGDSTNASPAVPGKGYMGGGGGGATPSGVAQAGATSVGGGAGGAANLTATATSGSAPGGGGGATGNGTSTAISSGAGGAGRIEVWVW